MQINKNITPYKLSTLAPKKALGASNAVFAQNYQSDAFISQSKTSYSPSFGTSFTRIIQRKASKGATTPNGIIQSLKKVVQSLNQIDPSIEIKNIRHNQNGVIRPRSRLKPIDICKVAQHDMQITTPEEIQNIIAKFDEKDQNLASLALQKITQFGNYNSLNEIIRSLKSLKATNLIEVNRGTLNDQLIYLDKKQFQQDLFIRPLNNDTLVLDADTLEYLKTDKDFCKEMSVRAQKIIYPEGWINGINPFNPSADLLAAAKSIVDSTKNILSQNSGISMNEALTIAINEPVNKALKELGLDKQLTIIKNPKCSDIEPTGENIAKQLSPNIITESDIDKALSKIPRECRQAALELLAGNMRVFSPQSLSARLKQMHHRIFSDGNIQGAYFLIPAQSKSYGLITNQYRLTNNIPVSQIVYDIDKIPQDAKKIIVLDDIAGSGDSLVGVYSCLRSNYRKDVVIAPVVSTKTAQKLFNRISDGICKYVPGEIVESFDETNYYKSLTKGEQVLFGQFMGCTGYGGEGLCVAFPHMAPDNNNSFFASFIAKKFTHNGNGVKNSNWEVNHAEEEYWQNKLNDINEANKEEWMYTDIFSPSLKIHLDEQTENLMEGFLKKFKE